jgi:hypothetical protein
MRNLAVRVRPTLFLPGDYILREGDTALGMYCLKRGKVYIYITDHFRFQSFVVCLYIRRSRPFSDYPLSLWKGKEKEMGK